MLFRPIYVEEGIFRDRADIQVIINFQSFPQQAIYIRIAENSATLASKAPFALLVSKVNTKIQTPSLCDPLSDEDGVKVYINKKNENTTPIDRSRCTPRAETVLAAESSDPQQFLL